jgi:hypothetical protein
MSFCIVGEIALSYLTKFSMFLVIHEVSFIHISIGTGLFSFSVPLVIHKFFFLGGAGLGCHLAGFPPTQGNIVFFSRSPLLHHISPIFLLLYSPLDTALLLV